MKTIVISGACSNIGKTTLAKAIHSILPESARIKIGHSAKKANKSGHFYEMGTTFSQLKMNHKDSPYLIIESNAILNDITPDLLIYLPGDNPKPSAKKASQMADITRGQVVTEEVLKNLSIKLNITDKQIRQIVWLSGCRPHKTSAIIMTGGKSSRMGKDKATIEIDGSKLVERTINKLRPCFDEIIISVANNSDKSYNFENCKVVYDELGNHGPLMGLYSSLKSSSYSVNFVIACDIPEIDLSLMYRLLSESVEYEAAVPIFKDDRFEPLFAMYTNKCTEKAKHLLDQKVKRMSALVKECNTKIIDDHTNDWYYNLNTPEQLKNFLSRGAANGC